MSYEMSMVLGYSSLEKWQVQRCGGGGAPGDSAGSGAMEEKIFLIWRPLYLTTLLGQMREEEGMVAPEFLPHASLHALQLQPGRAG